MSLITLGFILMGLEIIVPGGISFCLGLSLILVGLSQELGWVSGFFDSLLLMSFLSILFTSMSVFVMKRFFSGEAIHDVYDEDQEAIGKVAEAVSDFVDSQGLIFFGGSTWKARTSSTDESTIQEAVSIQKASSIQKGDLVQILGRDNITWVVQKHQST